MLKVIKQALQSFVRDSRGFTLMEVAVASAILSTGVGLVGTTVFQTLSIQRYWQEDVKATKDTRHAASWVAEDALRASATNLVDGDPAVNAVIITTDAGDIAYSVSSGNLVRQVGTDQNILAENVVSVAFSLSGQTMTFVLEVNSSRGGTETLTLQNYLRLLTS